MNGTMNEHSYAICSESDEDYTDISSSGEDDKINFDTLYQCKQCDVDEEVSPVAPLERQCWVCFASQEDDPSLDWTHPCVCSGTTKWVHQVCIQRWIDEKQKGNISIPVACPQCGTYYTIQFPSASFIVIGLDNLDNLIRSVCPVIVGGMCVGSLYWTCVTYGAVCVMQSMGHSRGMAIMEKADTMLLLMALPLVPIGLLLGHMVRWEEPVLLFLRRVVPKIRPAAYLMPMFAVGELYSLETVDPSVPLYSDTLCVTRGFCSALFLPVVASLVGSLFYRSFIRSYFKRTLAGGLTYICVKGVMNLYHMQHVYVRRIRRSILDYHVSDDNSES